MRILFVTPYYAPAWDFGGPVRAAETLARGLVQRGHEVHVWTSDAQSRSVRLPRSESEAVLSGVRVRRFPTWALRRLQQFNMLVTPGMATGKGLRAFDVVHLHEFRTFQNAWLLPRLTRLQVPYVLTPHGSFGRRGRVAFKVVYDTVAGRWLVRRARFVTALTRSEAADIQRLGVAPDQIRILPNAVGPPGLHRSTGAEARARLGLPVDEPVILFLGRLHGIKGPDLLLSAFATVRRRMRAHLLFAGPDEGMQQRLRRDAIDLGVADRVRFLGAVSGDDKEQVLDTADVVVLPSRSEGLPMTLLEALLRGKPAVCTDACAFDSELAAFAEVVRPDGEAIATGILNVLCEPVRAIQRAAGGRLFVERNYTSDEIATRAEQIYREAGAAG